VITRIALLVIIYLYSSTAAQSQKVSEKNIQTGLSIVNKNYRQENTIVKINSEKNYLIPAVEVIGLNLFVGAFNAYVTNEDFAKISFQTIKDNFESGFVWDEDNYLINQFFHPFHGANYFNTAR